MKGFHARFILCGMIRQQPDPWAYLTEHFPAVSVWASPDLGDKWGQTVWDNDGTATIYLAFDLGETQLRCTLAHELQHLERGQPCSPFCPSDELEVRHATGRWLLPDPQQIGWALARHDLNGAAAWLIVTRRVLVDRMVSATADEIKAIGAELRHSRRRIPHYIGAACRDNTPGHRRDSRENACSRSARRASSSGTSPTSAEAALAAANTPASSGSNQT